MKKLNELGVYVIESVGNEPNPNYHEVVGTEETTQDKGKIIKELTMGFCYKTDDETVVIKPSKVIVGV